MSMISDATEIGIDVMNRVFCAKTFVNEKGEISEKMQPGVAFGKRGLQLLAGGLVCEIKQLIHNTRDGGTHGENS